MTWRMDVVYRLTGEELSVLRVTNAYSVRPSCEGILLISTWISGKTREPMLAIDRIQRNALRDVLCTGQHVFMFALIG